MFLRGEKENKKKGVVCLVWRRKIRKRKKKKKKKKERKYSMHSFM